MTAPVEPEIRQEIDLSWVTFAEKDPTEPCRFHECQTDADWMLTTDPCGHQYPFCDFHTEFTKGMLSEYRRLICSDCHVLVHSIAYDPIKRG